MAPVDGSPAQQNVANFELVYSIKAENYLPVHKYKSKRTGLTVVIGDVEGPTVNGYFCLGKYIIICQKKKPAGKSNHLIVNIFMQ